MTSGSDSWTDRVKNCLLELADEKKVEVGQELVNTLQASVPPSMEHGDLAFAIFPFAKAFRGNPAALASEIAKRLDSVEGAGVEAAGAYLNIRLPRASSTSRVLRAVEAAGDRYGFGDSLVGARIMIEFSSPNTNKPLHLGHLRNNILGETLSRLLEAAGAEVYKVNLVNDRGIHICQSMLAYMEYGDAKTPESEGVKSDHFVGEYYVRYANWSKEDPSVAERAQELLQKWEAGDPEVRTLWETMNRWAVEGIKETYEATGISFDRIYFESETYAAGKAEILRGLEAGVFYRDNDGSVCADLEQINLDKKVLLRSDGTSLYVTQDIGTALSRRNDWQFDRLIYVVASEQRYHFQVLFHLLQLLGHEWADSLYHLSYGMVNLPEGKMKSREGTVVDADDLLAELERLAAEEIKSKEREDAVGDIDATSKAVALGALHYYLLQTGPAKDMIFSPDESISFTGDTGPYLQYMGARIASMLRKAPEIADVSATDISAEMLADDDSWALTRLLGRFPEVVKDSAHAYNPSRIATYAHELAREFSRFYHDVPIIIADDPQLRLARLSLSKAVLSTLKNCLRLINVPFLEVM